MIALLSLPSSVTVTAVACNSIPQSALAHARARVLQGGELSAFDDEAALKAERKAAAAEAASDRLREAYNELKYTAAGKVGRLRLMRMFAVVHGERVLLDKAHRPAAEVFGLDGCARWPI